MKEAVVCEPIRTPVGRFGGVFRDVTAAELAGRVVGEVMARTGLRESSIDDVVLGQGYSNSEAPAIGRVAALDAKFPVEVPGIQIDRRCGSGLQAVIYGAMLVQTSCAEFVVAGGVESMSQAEYYSCGLRWGQALGDLELVDRLGRGRVTAGGRFYPVAGGMVETAENLRREYGISRVRQDRYALQSHKRACAAQDAGAFDEEIVPVEVGWGGKKIMVSRDEHPRRDTSMEMLGSLRPIRLSMDAGATVTAGNASGQNDGAACCVVTHREAALDMGLKPIAKLRSWATAGVDPRCMGIGPVPATRRALERAGLSLSDMDLIECNEAFAAQVLACFAEWGLDDDADFVNVCGSGISLGHPIGATGARIMATLLREMQRRDLQFGLETMCIGGGQGIAAVFERV